MAAAPRCGVRIDQRARGRLFLCADRRARPAFAGRTRRVAEDDDPHARTRGGADRVALEYRAMHGLLALSARRLAGDVRFVVVYRGSRSSYGARRIDRGTTDGG